MTAANDVLRAIEDVRRPMADILVSKWLPGWEPKELFIGTDVFAALAAESHGVIDVGEETCYGLPYYVVRGHPDLIRVYSEPRP